MSVWYGEKINFLSTPGVFEALANPFLPVRALIRLDFSNIERPISKSQFCQGFWKPHAPTTPLTKLISLENNRRPSSLFFVELFKNKMKTSLLKPLWSPRFDFDHHVAVAATVVIPVLHLVGPEVSRLISVMGFAVVARRLTISSHRYTTLPIFILFPVRRYAHPKGRQTRRPKDCSANEAQSSSPCRFSISLWLAKFPILMDGKSVSVIPI